MFPLPDWGIKTFIGVAVFLVIPILVIAALVVAALAYIIGAGLLSIV